MPNKINLEINGKEFEGFTAIRIDKSLEEFAGSYNINITQKHVVNEDGVVIKNNSPVKTQDELRVLIDGESVLNGFVEELNLEHSSNGHSITFSGRDRTGRLVSSSIFPREYKSKDLKSIIENVLSDNGFSEIKVVSEINPLPKLVEEKIQASDGDTIFSFIDKYAKKIQVMVTTNGDGNIVLTREGTTTIANKLISQYNNNNNNIISAAFKLSTQDRFSNIEVTSQTDNETFGAQSAMQKASQADPEITLGGHLRVVSSLATTTSVLSDIAKWNVNVRKAKGRTYSCKVAGFHTERETGEIWKNNRLVTIKDDTAEMDGEFLIQGITYEQSISTGSNTTLSIVEKGAFSISIESTLKKNTNDFASGFQ